MFCPDCGSEYREGYYKCADCGTALVEELAKDFKRKDPADASSPVEIEGQLLQCHQCGSGEFLQTEAQLHSALLTFLGLEWMGKSATLYICGSCGFVHWFLPVRSEG